MSQEVGYDFPVAVGNELTEVLSKMGNPGLMRGTAVTVAAMLIGWALPAHSTTPHLKLGDPIGFILLGLRRNDIPKVMPCGEHKFMTYLWDDPAGKSSVAKSFHLSSFDVTRIPKIVIMYDDTRDTNGQFPATAYFDDSGSGNVERILPNYKRIDPCPDWKQGKH